MKLSLSWKTVMGLSLSAAGAELTFPPSGEMGMVVGSTCSDILDLDRGVWVMKIGLVCRGTAIEEEAFRFDSRKRVV